MIFFIKAITMGQEKVLVIQRNGSRMPVQPDAGLFGQVIKHPAIMIPGKIVQPDPPVRQLGNLSENPGKSPGYHSLIFKPEVKEITH